MFLMFQELQVSKLRKGRNPVSFSSGKRPWAQAAKEEGHEAQKGASHAARFLGRVEGPQMGPQHFLPEVFLWTTPSSPKTYALIFPRRDGAARAAKLSKLSAGETDPAAPELRRRGKSSPSSSPSPPWRGRRHLHHHPHQHLHLHHRHHRDPLRSPHSLIIATP